MLLINIVVVYLYGAVFERRLLLLLPPPPRGRPALPASAPPAAGLPPDAAWTTHSTYSHDVTDRECDLAFVRPISLSRKLKADREPFCNRGRPTRGTADG